MRPYLHLYITSKYAVVGTEKKYISAIILKKKLHDFAKFNPLFGRKKIITNHFFNKILPISVTFNDKHIDFYKEPEPEPEPEFNFEYEESSDIDSEDDETNIVINHNSSRFIYDSDSDSDSDSNIDEDSISGSMS